MPTVLMKLVGPMQSWGVVSRFDQRDTFREPTKSGIIGLICASMGIDRSDYERQSPLYSARIGVRHDKPGTLRYDYQTAACKRGDAIVRADGKFATDGGVVSRRYYLADAAFLAGIESDDVQLLRSVCSSLSNPVWPLYLGRKSYVPSEPLLCSDEVLEMPLEEALRSYPWISRRRVATGGGSVLLSLENSIQEGLLIMDQPVGPLAERRFAGRYLRTETIEIC